MLRSSAIDTELVAQVRRFNRLVTQRVGALHDHYLARGRSLGEARVLWELDADGTELRALRARLDLDSGYLSRVLRALEADGLVRVGAGATDGRVRTARPTARGRRERTLLDRRSDELAAALLEPLSPAQRDRLAAAMRDVERLLTVGLVTVAPMDPADRRARHCLEAYVAELDTRFDAGFDVDRSLPASLVDLRPPAGVLLVASLRGEPIGCGAVKLHGRQPAELKRMWVDPAARGLGVGRRLLAALETWAADHGAGVVRLETNRALTEAIALYRSAGYLEVPAFNDEAYAHHWFEKELAPRPDAGSTPATEERVSRPPRARRGARPGGSAGRQRRPPA